MTLKLKAGCWYECERDDWREIVVCGFAGVVEPDEGPVIVRASQVPGSWMDLFAIDEDGYEICEPGVPDDDPQTPLSATVQWGAVVEIDGSTSPWDEVAHAALVERGWFTPWEVV